MNRLSMSIACLIAAFVAAPLRADAPASQPASDADGIALWMHGQRGQAVNAFVQADWTNGAFVAKDPLLGLTEAEYDQDDASDPAKQKELTDKTQALKALARQVLSLVPFDVKNGETSTARQILMSVDNCGKYLSNHDGELSILKLIGAALVKAAEADLAKLPAGN